MTRTSRTAPRPTPDTPSPADVRSRCRPCPTHGVNVWIAACPICTNWHLTRLHVR